MRAKKRDIVLDEWSPDILAGDDSMVAIKKLFEHVESNARSSVAWYSEKKAGKSTASRTLRAVAIVLAIVGSLTPIISGMYPQPWIGQLGFALLALAAGAVAADRYFGISSGWIRYVTAMLALDRALAAFRMDWSLLLLSTGAVPDATMLTRFLGRARQFQDEVLKIIADETQTWVAEFQSNLADLEKTLATQKDAARSVVDAVQKAAPPPRTGAIVVNLSAAPVPDTRLFIDEQSADDFAGQRFGKTDISPGLHTIGISGNTGSGPFKMSTVAEVKAGEVTTVSFEL